MAIAVETNRYMYESVLLATDGSETSEGACVHGLWLSHRLGATAHIVSVVDTGLRDRLPVGAGTLRAQRSASHKAIDRLVSVAEEIGVKTVETALDGPPGEQLLEYADDVSIDCLVLGSRGRGALIQYVLGSVALQLIRETTSPVITRSGPPLELTPQSVRSIDYETILVATDGSESAQAGVRTAAALAEKLDATVHALYVINELAYTTHPPPNRSWKTYRRRLEREGRTVLDHAQSIADTHGVVLTETMKVGIPEAEIESHTREIDADCLVMGTRGLSGLKRGAIGSVVARTIRSVAVPVLTVSEEIESSP
ncbi:universal stress protein [Halocatena halophila]|uniref:universal stress protein n=1 Tax=Halocatena halophila TaxID=2814576 RepID=UPI002ED4A859